MPFYPNPVRAGTDAVTALGDGTTINIKWFQAEHSVRTNKIAYQIYYSTIKEEVYAEGPKYVSIDGALQANIIGLTPGQEYFMAVRPLEYNPAIYNLTTLPVAHDNLRYYPNSILSANISSSALTIPLMDASEFPNSGIIKVGVELIQYTTKNTNNLIVSPSTADTPVQLVLQPDGYYSRVDGYVGDGYINGLTVISNSGAPTENWRIVCSLVDGGTAKFAAQGSISGPRFDGYGNPFIWQSDGYTVSNGVLSFNITQGLSVFVPGDAFLIKIAGAVPGTIGGRGYANHTALSHTTDGYDGYNYWDPTVRIFTIGEDARWDRIFVSQARFEYPHYAYTVADGYHQVIKDILSTDLSASDASNVTFPPYDYAGYHRTDPVQLLDGTCVGSYIGGEQGCIDQYGNYQVLRGMSLQDQNTQRQELKLTVDGRDAILISRVNTGITCSCYLPSSEYPDDRCPICYGTKFVFGYEQYFNPRISSGRIKVRLSPTVENLKMREAGMESEFPLEMWTLTVPTIKTRDIIVLFDQDGINEEFRYEVSDVTRNNTILGLQGGQLMKTFRIRKFDPAYQVRIFRDSSMFPKKLNTSISFVPGIAPHLHEIVVNENIVSISQINQTTAVAQGHNHPIINGIVMEVLGHDHKIILP